MAAEYYVLLQAETGKSFVRPFSYLNSIRESFGFQSPELRKPILLPEPFRFFGDSVAVYRGKPINFMASFYCGLNNNRVVYGDIAIVKQGARGACGLDETEMRFVCLSLSQCFGCAFPSFASA